jgi:sulfatase modifying factor 1
LRPTVFLPLLLLWFLSTSAHATDPPPQLTGPNAHRFVIVPTGTYQLGARNSTRNPPHESRVDTFAIATTETTNAQFAAFTKATGYVTDAEKNTHGKVSLEGMRDWAWELIKGADWRHPSGPGGPGWEELRDHPVTQISGADATAYCEWLGARLPTLDEWEIAARAGATTLYPWGGNYENRLANTWNGATHERNTREDGFVYTSPVKSFPPNAWGLYDVIGNVFEYCTGLTRDARPGDEVHMISGRGGSWWCSSGTCHFFNLVDIGRMDRHGTLSNQGFRVAIDPKKLKKGGE